MLFKTILIYFLENTMLKISDSFLIAKLPPHMRLILMTIARDVCGKIAVPRSGWRAGRAW
jgi:hypothetical protein